MASVPCGITCDFFCIVLPVSFLPSIMYPRPYTWIPKLDKSAGGFKLQSELWHFEFQRFIERRYGRFERAIRLPQNVKADGIEAEYINGVLKVAVPKTAESSRHKIKIGSGSSGGIFSRIAHKLSGNDASVGVKSGGSTPQQSEMKH
jgi:hypothetical protein